jgi:hypothetical protein
MSSVDWSARPDQIEGLALREVTVDLSDVFPIKTPISETFRNLPPFLNLSVRVPKLKSL